MKQKYQQRKTRRGWETGVSWKVAGARVVMGAVLAAGMAGAVVAQGPSVTNAAPISEGEPQQQPGATSTREFHIPAGQLTAAMDAFHEATGLKVKFKVPAGDLSGVRTAGVDGTYTDAGALRRLLDKTGLAYAFEGTSTVEIALRNSETVDVNAAVASVALQQLPQSLLDTAQTVNVVPQYVLQEQGATTMRDGLRNVPGISIAAGEGGSQGDNLTIRGFSARNDIYLDGIRDFGSYYRDSFDYESIDVLQGPASAEFGRGSTGGVVNQETKVPRLQEHLGGTLQLGTNLMRRVTADVNEPIANIPGGTAFRVNVVGSQNNVSQRNVAQTSRYGIAPSLAFGLNTRTRATLSYLHESEDSTPDYGLPYFGLGPAAVDRKTYYGYAKENYLRTNPDVVTGKVEHDFGGGATVRNIVRWGNYPRDVRITEPQINTTPIYTKNATTGVVTGVCSATAATPCYNVNTPLSQVMVRRAEISRKSTEDILWDQASVLGRLKLAKLDNNFVVIVEGGRERSRPVSLNFPTTIFTPAVNPNADDILPAALTVGAKTRVTSTSYGAGFNDTMKIREWLLLSGGVRFDYFNTFALTDGALAGTARLDKMPTYRAAVVIKPRPAGSIYFDWGTSFNPSAESLSLSANNATQAPQTNETYEVGAKWAFMRDRLNVNGAYFQTLKANVYETDPTNTVNVIPVGDQRVKGLQFGVLGHMPKHFDVVAGYAYLNGRVASSIQNYSPFAAFYKAGDPVYGTGPFFLSSVGNPFANVPKNSANLWVTHDLLWGFVGGFGMNQVSARRASSTSPTAVLGTSAATDVRTIPLAYKVMPGYVIFSALVRRPISDKLDFQVNIQNLGNKFYIDQPHPNHLIPGEGINAQFGFLAHF